MSAMFYYGDDRQWMADLKTHGYGEFVTPQGERVLVTHGSESGDLPCLRNAGASQLARPDFVICCFPEQVAKRFPGLTVVGDWAEETKPVCRNRWLIPMSRTEATRQGLIK